MQGPQAQLLRTVMPFLTFGFMWFQPGGVQLFFITTSAMATLQTMIITNSAFRRFMLLPPVITPKASTPQDDAPRPGGLNIYDNSPPMRVIEVPAKEKKNVSFVDRVVDKAKDRRDELLGGLKSTKENVWGKTEDRMARRTSDSMKRKADAYELSRRRELQWERESKNRSKVEKSVVDALTEEEDGGKGQETSTGAQKTVVRKPRR